MTSTFTSLLNWISELYLWQRLEVYCWYGVVTLQNLLWILQQHEELPSQHLVCNFGRVSLYRWKRRRRPRTAFEATPGSSTRLAGYEEGGGVVGGTNGKKCLNCARAPSLRTRDALYVLERPSSTILRLKTTRTTTGFSPGAVSLIPPPPLLLLPSNANSTSLTWRP